MPFPFHCSLNDSKTIAKLTPLSFFFFVTSHFCTLSVLNVRIYQLGIPSHTAFIAVQLCYLTF